MGFWDQLAGTVGYDTGNGPLSGSSYATKATQAAPYDPTNPAASRSALMSLADHQGAIAAGTAPDPVAMQARQNLGQVQAQTLGTVAQAGRGANPGALAALAGAQSANTAQTAAGQAAVLEAQQRQAALQAQAAITGQVAGNDLQTAGLQQGNTQFNAGQQNTLTQQQNAAIIQADAARKLALMKLLAGATAAGSSAGGSVATGGLSSLLGPAAAAA